MLGSNFEVFLADNRLARSIHYRLRYQVYCLETGFENADRFPDGQEHDEFDKFSIHFLVRSKHTGEWVAAIRLIHPQNGLLSMESFCQIDPAQKDRLIRHRVMEASRLSVIESVRRRKQGDNFCFGYRHDPNSEEVYFGSRERCKQPEVLITIIKAALTYSRETGIQYVYFLITPALARLLTRLRIKLNIIGQSCQHRGLRYPYSLNVEDAYRTLDWCSPLSLFSRHSVCYRNFSDSHNAVFQKTDIENDAIFPKEIVLAQ